MLPAIVADIGGAAYVSWTVSIYEVGSVVAGAASALMSIRYGLRRPMAAAACVFALGCAASALSPSMQGVLVGRALQGLGGGGLVALGFAVVLISAGGVRVELLRSTLLIAAGLACLIWFVWRDACAGDDRLLPAKAVDPFTAAGGTMLMLRRWHPQDATR
jgi:MFS family permease